MDAFRNAVFVSAALLMAALPSSATYKLNSYGFGSGGTANSTSTNYGLNGTTGEVAGTGTSTNYKAGAGEKSQKQANVPLVTMVNNDNWYNKLLVTIVPQNHPSDAKFGVAISKDNFVTTQYVKSDFTVSSTHSLTDYLSYAAWGSGAGQEVRGLIPGTVYSVRASAYRGKYTESAYGPMATASTSNAQLAFDIDVSTTDSSTSPPYALNFGNLGAGTVTDSPKRIWVSFDTNGESGGSVYMSGKNSGLTSTAVGYTIGSVTGDLAALAEGFGAQGVTATQALGGPFSLVAPFDGTGTNVGTEDAVIREVFSATNPVTAGRGSLVLKAKTKVMTPPSPDYTETITMVCSVNF